jgi:hypothetical protein
MIQFNLLPNVKVEYIKAQKTRRMVIAISVVVTVVAIALLLLSLAIDGLQKKHLSDLSADVQSRSSRLQAVPELDSILTVQNQLESLTPLHDGKIAAPRLFSYLNQITPSSVSISNFTTDFTMQTATVSGNATNLSDVNQYVDTLKFTTYTTTSDTTPADAFSNIVLSSFSLGSGQQGSAQKASYSITFSYDPALFNNTDTISLDVPTQTTTRSDIAQPSNLFSASPTPTTTTSTAATNAKVGN